MDQQKRNYLFLIITIALIWTGAFLNDNFSPSWVHAGGGISSMTFFATSYGFAYLLTSFIIIAALLLKVVVTTNWSDDLGEKLD